jgi:probable phosphoglycerate mutase
MISGMPPSEIVLVRHGETEWSRAGRHTSFSDVALTEHGRAQARALAPRLAAWAFREVLTSPRRRARETCDLAGLGNAAGVADDLAEWDYGEYEGRTSGEIRVAAPGWTVFNGDPPGGETAAEVASRADRVLARVDAVGGVVALFSHGHFLRVLGARWIGLSAADGAVLALDTGTLSVLSREHEHRVIRVWNS